MILPRPPDTPDLSEALRRLGLLQDGLDLLDQGLTLFDRDLRLAAWNETLTRLLEIPLERLYPGMPFEEIIRYNADRGEYGPGDPAEQTRVRVEAARRFQPHCTERVRPNGRIIAIRGEPLPNQGFVTLYTDVTEQRAYERLIRQQNQELERRVQERTAELTSANASLKAAKSALDGVAEAYRRSEERLRVITDAIPALIAQVDRDYIYRFANRSYAAWFGHTKESIIGQHLEAVAGTEVFAHVRPYLEQAATGRTVSYEYTMTRNGRPAHARSIVVPDLDQRGQVRGFFVSSADITEQKASEAALRQAQKMEAVGQLTGGLAHDFNNLLTIVLGNLKALLEQHPGAPWGPTHVTPAVHAGERGAELIRRLLSFSRQQPLLPRQVDARELVLNMAALIQRSLPPGVRLLTTLPDGPVQTCIDPHQLENALLNLAINARDAMPEGGTIVFDVGAVTLSAEDALPLALNAGHYALLRVVDTGTGIPVEVLQRVFEPFFTTKGFGAGSGLGLSMVYGFVRQSGGAVALDSEPGKGTVVRLYLPREAATPAPAEITVTPPAAAGLALLVDDNPDVRQVVRELLTSLGHPVLEAASGAEALALLQNLPDVAVLLTDLVMPGAMDGRALAEAARQLRPDLPILLMTGFAEHPQPEPGAPSPGPLLRKPFDREALARALSGMPAPD